MKCYKFVRWMICWGMALIFFGQTTVFANQLYQVSLLNGLMQGDYDGSTTVGELLKYGDLGIGTFDSLDGEMIVLDGIAYKAKADGSVEVQPAEERVPFAMVTNFKQMPAFTELVAAGDIEELKSRLDGRIARQTGNFNAFYVVRIDGTFDLAHVRSVEKQAEPYRPLAEVALYQKEHIHKDIKGSIVGIRCPAYADGINLPAWHFHFLSADRSKGGHLLNLEMKNGQAKFNEIYDWHIVLPNSSRFAGLALEQNMREETRRVESRSK